MVELAPRQRQYLKGLAHKLRPVVQIGADGPRESVHAAIEQALEDHELIKVQVSKSFEGERAVLGQEIAQSAEAALCQQIGRVFVLYRPRRKPAKGRKAITLP